MTPLSTAERVWLAVIFIAACVLRLAWNDVTSFSPADETVYVDLSQRLVTHGFFSEYRALAREWIDDPSWWRYPNPLRCGYLALGTVALRIYGTASPRALAWLSTLAGIAVVPLLFATARRLAGTRTALVAAALVAVSPLELAMGRRALQDEVFCAAALLAFLAIVAVADDEKGRGQTFVFLFRGDRAAIKEGVTAKKKNEGLTPLVLAIAAMTFAFSVKETFALLYPALAAFLALTIRPRPIAVKHVALFVAPPLLWWLGLAALTRDLTMPLRTARLVAGAMASRYVVQYQSGPPQRLLVDFLFLSPLVTVLACAAVILLLRDPHASAHMRGLAAFLLVALAAFSLMASKNLRFVVMLDPFLRIAAAWLIVHPGEARTARLSSVVALVAANAAIDIELFHAVFIRGAVYDPVTRTLFAALGAVPRDAIASPEPMLWPWICVVIAAVWWMIPQARGAVTRKLAVS